MWMDEREEVSGDAGCDSPPRNGRLLRASHSPAARPLAAGLYRDRLQNSEGLRALRCWDFGTPFHLFFPPFVVDVQRLIAESFELERTFKCHLTQLPHSGQQRSA